MSELFLNLLNRAIAAGWVVLAVLLLRLVLLEEMQIPFSCGACVKPVIIKATSVWQRKSEFSKFLNIISASSLPVWTLWTVCSVEHLLLRVR